MSGYRALHRHTETKKQTDNEIPSSVTATEACPVFAVQFSPCNQTHITQRSNTSPHAHPPTRLLTSSADGYVRCYNVIDKARSGSSSDVLDASALSMSLDQIMLLSSEDTYEQDSSVEEEEAGSSSTSNHRIALGSAAISVVRNYVGEDSNAGGEVSVAIRLDGHVSLWKRDEQPVYPQDNEEVVNTTEEGQNPIHLVKPHGEFQIDGATGTTIQIIPPQLTGFSRHGLVLMVGMLDGSVSFLSTGVDIPNSRKSNPNEESKLKVGEVLDQVGAGNSIPLSLALHPTHCLTFAVGRKDGTVDLYSSGNSSNGNGNGNVSDDIYGQFRRCHRLNHHAGTPIRALAYTPDGSLLLSGCDEGHIYIHDASSFLRNETIPLVAAIHNAHRGYILSIAPLPDSKRFVTSSADKTVKVWNVGTPNSGPVHTFESGNESMVWDVSCSYDGRRCVSCCDDGCVQIYSSEE